VALGATLGKAEVVKTWKSVVKALGFVDRENMFHLKETIDQPLHFTISIQRNLHCETYMIHATILIKSPFEQDSSWQFLVMGKLRPNDAALHREPRLALELGHHRVRNPDIDALFPA